MEKTISMAQLAKNAEQIAKDIDSAGTVYRIKRPGRRTIFLVDQEYLEGWKAAFEEMQVPNWREKWDQADRDLAAMRGRPLDEIRRELGRDHLAKRRGGASIPRATSGRGRQSGRRSGRTSRRPA